MFQEPLTIGVDSAFLLIVWTVCDPEKGLGCGLLGAGALSSKRSATAALSNPEKQRFGALTGREGRMLPHNGYLSQNVGEPPTGQGSVRYSKVRSVSMRGVLLCRPNCPEKGRYALQSD